MKIVHLALLGLFLNQISTAQSLSHLYSINMSQSTIAANPGSGLDDYFTTETTIRPAVGVTTQIHAVRYDHNGAIINISATDQDYILADFGANCRNVDIVPLATDKFLQVSYYLNTTNEPTKVKIRLAILEFSGSSLVVTAENIIEATDPDYNSLYALDAVYDEIKQQFVICGMVTKDLNDLPQDSKYAFVLTVDPTTLSPIKLMYYDSNTGGANDYDIATRVVLTQDGNYYVTGAENVLKFNQYWNMGMRNMLIDAATLQYGGTGTWSNPLVVNSDNHEIGADMVEVNGVYYVLVNISGGPSIIDIDPATGNFINPAAQWIGIATYYGNSITQVDPTSTEVVVHGIQYQNIDVNGNCQGSYAYQAEPFSAVLDINSYPGTLVAKTEYRTIIGNSGTGSDFWTWGDVYRPVSGYYVFPIFYNKFATFSGTNNDFGIIAPIHSPITLLNTKFIFTNAIGETDCPTLECGDFSETYEIEKPFFEDQWIETEAAEEVSEIEVLLLDVEDVEECDGLDPYYKTTQQNNGLLINGSVSNVIKHNKTSIYPNPATNEIKIELEDTYSSNVSISLIDITGKKIVDVFNGENNHQIIKYTIPVGIANGIYHISISAKEQKTVTYKVNIIR